MRFKTRIFSIVESEKANLAPGQLEVASSMPPTRYNLGPLVSSQSWSEVSNCSIWPSRADGSRHCLCLGCFFQGMYEPESIRIVLNDSLETFIFSSSFRNSVICVRLKPSYLLL